MNINELVNEYGEKKEKLDRLKKETEKLSAEIKKSIGQNGVETERYKATVVVSERTSMDEDKAIEVLHGTGIEDEVVKTKLYVDTDALENLIYKGAVDSTLIAKLHECIKVKQVESLRISKRKGV